MITVEERRVLGAVALGLVRFIDCTLLGRGHLTQFVIGETDVTRIVYVLQQKNLVTFVIWNRGPAGGSIEITPRGVMEL